MSLTIFNATFVTADHSSGALAYALGSPWASADPEMPGIDSSIHGNRLHDAGQGEIALIPKAPAEVVGELFQPAVRAVSAFCRIIWGINNAFSFPVAQAAAPVDKVEDAEKQIDALESRLPEINSQLDAVERLRDAKMATVKEKLDALQNRVQKISVRISEGWGGQHNEDCTEEINEGEISPLLTEAEALQTQSESLAEEAARVKAEIEDLRADYLDGGERPVYD